MLDVKLFPLFIDCDIEIVSPSTLNVDIPDGCVQTNLRKLERKSVHFVSNPFECKTSPPSSKVEISSPLCSLLPSTPAKETNPATPSIPSIWDTPVQNINIKHSPDAVVIRSDNVVRSTILSDIEWCSPTKVIADQTLPEEDDEVFSQVHADVKGAPLHSKEQPSQTEDAQSQPAISPNKDDVSVTGSPSKCQPTPDAMLSESFIEAQREPF